MKELLLTNFERINSIRNLTVSFALMLSFTKHHNKMIMILLYTKISCHYPISCVKLPAIQVMFIGLVLKQKHLQCYSQCQLLTVTSFEVTPLIHGNISLYPISVRWTSISEMRNTRKIYG